MIHGRFTRKSTEPITKGPTKQSNGWAVIVANVSLVIDIHWEGGRDMGMWKKKKKNRL